MLIKMGINFYYAHFYWASMNVMLYKSTIETSLQSPQFEIIHRYFSQNYNLHLWIISDNKRCAYCNAVNIFCHYFVECESVEML